MLSGMPMQFFWCSFMGRQRTHHIQTFRILSCCNAQTIVALPALCEKHPAISYRMSVIVIP